MYDHYPVQCRLALVWSVLSATDWVSAVLIYGVLSIIIAVSEAMDRFVGKAMRAREFATPRSTRPRFPAIAWADSYEYCDFNRGKVVAIIMNSNETLPEEGGPNAL